MLTAVTVGSYAQHTLLFLGGISIYFSRINFHRAPVYFYRAV
jgi:hypothetical protein